ncbi:hypothetical protein JHK84_037308 [Glycine max]|nr:hypothetical protein JHK85_037658 [Glycine max]KAG5130911.1 hypothetical protein JHK84_037308 [Glycine max]
MEVKLIRETMEPFFSHAKIADYYCGWWHSWTQTCRKMNQYHIYEAIGRGRYSTVYKGRKKKTIEYFAIKSVDKSQKTKVLEEDSQLPEDSVYDFAYDIVKALQ